MGREDCEKQSNYKTELQGEIIVKVNDFSSPLAARTMESIGMRLIRDDDADIHKT